jgi:hypothetical protein
MDPYTYNIKSSTTEAYYHLLKLYAAIAFLLPAGEKIASAFMMQWIYCIAILPWKLCPLEAPQFRNNACATSHTKSRPSVRLHMCNTKVQGSYTEFKNKPHQFYFLKFLHKCRSSK